MHECADDRRKIGLDAATATCTVSDLDRLGAELTNGD
jgi:hypothetical protein